MEVTSSHCGRSTPVHSVLRGTLAGPALASSHTQLHTLHGVLCLNTYEKSLSKRGYLFSTEKIKKVMRNSTPICSDVGGSRRLLSVLGSGRFWPRPLSNSTQGSVFLRLGPDSGNCGPKTAGASHDSPRAHTCTFQGPSKTPPKFHERTSGKKE